MKGLDFDRQKPLNDFVVDFYCKELMLAIEIDGDSHYYNYEAGMERQKKLEKLGVKFLRFSDKEVIQNMPNVPREIEAWIEANS